MLTLSDTQATVIKAIRGLTRGEVLILRGYAGTGKSTTISHLVHGGGVACVMAPTGKAAVRLRNLGNPAATIHSVLYQPVDSAEPGKELKWTLSDFIPLEQGDLVVVDEASMVTPRIAQDLLDLVDRLDLRLVLVGDGYQLPPILSAEEEKDWPKGFSILQGDGLPGAEIIELNEVFRQALDSPILAAITSLRCGGPAGPRAGQQDYVARIGERGDVARLALQATAEEEDVVAITWRNIDRQTINGVVRRGLGHRDELPESGEPLMVLANAHRIGLMNGEIVRLAGYAWGEKTWPILEYQEEPRGIRASVDVAGLQISVILVVDFLATDGRLPTDLRPGDLYRRRLGVPEATKQAMLVVDYGYAATAHKAQGSEWEHAIVHVPAEICKWPDHRRWIYTAMSRARSRLTVVYGRGLSSMFT